MRRVLRMIPGLLLPRISLYDLRAVLAAAVLGAIVAGVYGALHDQLTYSLSREYFTKLKFHQFDYADPGLGERAFAAVVGLLATWWVGFVAAWFLGRRLFPGQPRATAWRRIALGFAVVLAGGLLGGLAGYAYGVWRGPEADLAGWQWAIERFGVTDARSFVRVAYIHNGGYVGGALGLLAALLTIHPNRRPLQDMPPVE
ncbi:hypothetical protein Mal64_22070 [Pseudobythopirellula maris]|uniref:Uncharacterized protein n=1 Tax=Pseudobythopirellula maris TaxID=2527991 RepID=A0A5C5ZMR7_9BACT|nr:signal peptide-containing protein [Pseudobythopirellula maris]TWT88719.1 hypothetical protein Mal64_22070 [Pseudobythopirellula maris]